MPTRYFQYKKESDSYIFTGDRCDMYFPMRYRNYNLLTHGDMLQALGVCDMTINETMHGGLCIAGVISISPSETNEVNINGDQHLVATLYRGDTFMNSRDVIRNDGLAGILWNEFIALGRLPSFVNYQNIHLLFDKICEVCGVKFGVDHAIFEMVYAHIFRDKDDVAKKYRHTDMTKPPTIVPLRSISYGPDTTLDKIVGSYSNDGINSALVNSSNQTSDIEIQMTS